MGGYRREQYQDVLEALKVMRFVHMATPQTQVYLRMFQLESQVLPRRSDTSAPVRGERIRGAFKKNLKIKGPIQPFYFFYQDIKS